MGAHEPIADDLTPADLARITKCTQTAAQKRVLDRNGIYYIECPDGSITVCWYHVHHPRLEQARANEPNWAAAKSR